MQNEDFVWHLVLGTLLTLFFGMRPAGQVHRSVAHRLSQRPLASAVCPLATLPSLSQLSAGVGGEGFSPPPCSQQAGGISQEVPLAVFICSDEK